MSNDDLSASRAAPTTLSDLYDLVYRRRGSLLILFMVSLFAALSQHVFGIVLPPSFSPALVVGGLTLIAWVTLVWVRGETNAQHLRRERRRVVEQHAAFRATVAGFLTPTGVDDEPEAAALQEGLLRRNDALMAARRALGNGGAPERDAAVLEKTTPGERGDATGAELLSRLAALQREALSGAQRMGLLGEAMTSRLDQQVFALVPLHGERRPRQAGEAGEATNPVLVLLVTGYGVLLPLVSAQRIASVLVGALCGGILILFESAASARRGRDPGP
jgi:hypothetical protein